MEIINNQVIGDLTITKDSQYNNLLCDDVVIEENVIARLFGIVEKDITLKGGSTGYLHGRCNGKIINQGGILYIFLPNGQIETH